MEIIVKSEHAIGFCEDYLEFVKKSSTDYFNKELTENQEESYIHGLGLIGGYMKAGVIAISDKMPNKDIHISTVTKATGLGYGLNVYTHHSEGKVATLEFDGSKKAKMLSCDQHSFNEGKKDAVLILEEFMNLVGEKQ